MTIKNVNQFYHSKMEKVSMNAGNQKTMMDHTSVYHVAKNGNT